MNDATVLGDARTHATDRVPIARPGEYVGSVRRLLIGARFDCADDLDVVSEGVLVGMVPIERLLCPDSPLVTPTADQESVAWEMVRRGGSGVVVVDDEGRSRAGPAAPHAARAPHRARRGRGPPGRLPRRRGSS